MTNDAHTYGRRVFLSTREGHVSPEPQPGLESLKAFIELNRRMRVIAGLPADVTVDRSATRVIRTAPK